MEKKAVVKRKLWLPHLSLQLPSKFCHRRRRRKKKTKCGKVKIGSSLYFADDMLCSFVSNGDSFFLKAITYQLLQHHQSLSLTVSYSRGAAAAVTTNSFFDVLKTKQKSYEIQSERNWEDAVPTGNNITHQKMRAGLIHHLRFAISTLLDNNTENYCPLHHEYTTVSNICWIFR